MKLKSKFYSKSVYTLITLMCVLSCDNSSNFTPNKGTESLHYSITHIDKEKKTTNYKQTYQILENNKGNVRLLRNDGKLINYTKTENALVLNDVDYIFEGLIDLPKEKLEYEEKNVVLKFPLKKDESWTTNDLTTLIMKMGYDRIFQTLLPIEIENVVSKVSDTVKVNGKVYKNCIKIVGEGNTSYNPGPPLDNINIKVKTTQWFYPGIGLIKMKREEHSDSETMGSIYYEKLINF